MPSSSSRAFSHSSRVPHQDDPSDDDLTLDDLDPASSSAAPTRTSAFGLSSYTSNAMLGRSGSRSPAHSSTRKEQDDEEDLRGLLENDDGDDDGSSPRDSLRQDDTPLLDSDGRFSAQSRPPKPNKPSAIGRFFSSSRNKTQEPPQTPLTPGADDAGSRQIHVGRAGKFPSNAVSNAKYSPWSFLPRTLYNEFSFFFNLYFLLVALSQTIPPLRIGYLSTYVAPLAFVLTITLGKEAYDDIIRRRRDAELNAERFTVLQFDDPDGSYQQRKSKRKDRTREAADEERFLDGQSLRQVREVSKPSKDLKVGDVLKLGKDQRVPADAVILKSAIGEGEQGDGEVFIRTDQLDGETDWKLRIAPSLSQPMDLADLSRLFVCAGRPEKKVNDFLGNLSLAGAAADPSTPKSVGLNIDNTAWANTVLASTVVVYAMVVYTGRETRQALSTSQSRSKVGLLEYEINSLTKILCAITLLLSIILVAAYKFESPDGSKWYVAIMRFLILFSSIVPISLRVNLDLGKSVYAWFIHRDSDMPETVVRTSTIPEDLGRVEYLLSDKTGTLTQNDMQLKKIHIGTVSYANDAMEEVAAYVKQGYGLISHGDDAAKKSGRGPGQGPTRMRREIGSRVRDVVLALALCHNVTPTVAQENGKDVTVYQASSPDEIAIVKWTESVGLRLAQRDRHRMVLESNWTGEVVARVEILNMFPFTSEGKRMGIIVRFVQDFNDAATSDSDTVWFFQKGADTVMSSIVQSNDWLDEETANMAREGLRTLVVGRKKMTMQTYRAFAGGYKQASTSLRNRDAGMAKIVQEYLESDLELLGITGVEDKLQQDVKPSLELLRNAGVKIWMLTGDKVETARCVAVSSKLVARGQYVHTIAKMTSKESALEALEFLRSKPDACLLIDGDSLGLMLRYHREAFITITVELSAVVACRCSPTQKADVALLIRKHTGKRVCCIGDGGNDVSMIQAADVGIGIVGKEGRQASLAADFSITHFHHLTKLLLWHGRNSYKRSAKLAQFVMHRGLIISVCQTVFSISARYEPKALYRDWLLVGYATVYTMMPVFSLVLDTDIPPRLAHVYPELYAELSASRALSYGTFFGWVAISMYQGVAIQLLSQILTQKTGLRMVAVSYTALIINELGMVASEVTTWHWIMLATIAATCAIYFGSLPGLGGYFDLPWVWSPPFWWRMVLVATVALVPVIAGKLIRGRVRPESYTKVLQGL